MKITLTQQQADTLKLVIEDALDQLDMDNLNEVADLHAVMAQL